MKSKIKDVKIKYIRGMKGIYRRKITRNYDVRTEQGQTYRKKQLMQWGHFNRMAETKPVKRIWQMQVATKRDKGRSRKNWNNIMKQSIERRKKIYGSKVGIVEKLKLMSKPNTDSPEEDYDSI